ncbi:MAG: DUF4239 domain-containing protein [Chloroflexi bacterium]|nr:DUF4239 domain-containing protein [Chloroflexota bacterium]
MPFTQKVLLTVPTALLGVIIVVGALVLSILGLLLVRRFISHDILKQHNDVAGFIFATLGVVYAVLLAFSVIIVWETFDKSASNVNLEAAYLMDVFRDAQGLPQPFRTEFRKRLIHYTEVIAEDEWDTMQRGERSPRTIRAITNLWVYLCNFEPETAAEKVLFQDAVVRLNDSFKLANQRIFECKRGLNSVLWFVLIFGGAITVSFTYFFGMENLKAQIIMTSLLTSIIALILFTILIFDYPFTGDLRASPEPFFYILNIFKHIVGL